MASPRKWPFCRDTSITLFDVVTHEQVGSVSFDLKGKEGNTEDLIMDGALPEHSILTDDGQKLVAFCKPGCVRFHDIAQIPKNRVRASTRNCYETRQARVTEYVM